jgi:hypothetical protein
MKPIHQREQGGGRKEEGEMTRGSGRGAPHPHPSPSRSPSRDWGGRGHRRARRCRRGRPLPPRAIPARSRRRPQRRRRGLPHPGAGPSTPPPATPRQRQPSSAPPPGAGPPTPPPAAPPASGVLRPPASRRRALRRRSCLLSRNARRTCRMRRTVPSAHLPAAGLARVSLDVTGGTILSDGFFFVFFDRQKRHKWASGCRSNRKWEWRRPLTNGPRELGPTCH